MSFRLSANSRVERILLISLSNIGDVVLTFPVFDALREAFPRARFVVVTGPKAKGFFVGNTEVVKVVAYDKKRSWIRKWKWLQVLRRERFDLVVDLRNSMLPFLLRARCVTPPVLFSSRSHMKEKHLRHMDAVMPVPVRAVERHAIFLSPEKRASVASFIEDQRDYVIVAPGAANDKKRWHEEGFREVVRHLAVRRKKRVVLVGDKRDRIVAKKILKDAPPGVINLAGATDLAELAGVIQRAALAVTNDSGIMHLASYFNVPTVALFGPTDPFLYGPWSSWASVVRGGASMSDILITDVLSAIDKRLETVKYR